jgi:hypothetical protein
METCMPLSRALQPDLGAADRNIINNLVLIDADSQTTAMLRRPIFHALLADTSLLGMSIYPCQYRHPDVHMCWTPY